MATTDLSSPFHARGTYTYMCIYAHTGRRFIASGGERNGKEKKGQETWLDAGRLESWPFCDMLVFNDPGRNSLRSTYLLNGDV